MCLRRVVTEWNFSLSRLPLGARLGVCSRCPSIDAFFFPAETHGKVRSAMSLSPHGSVCCPGCPTPCGRSRAEGVRRDVACYRRFRGQPTIRACLQLMAL